MLETTLRGYSCLTVGDTMCVHYNNKKYFIDVVEARPAQAICVIDTDCQVRQPGPPPRLGEKTEFTLSCSITLRLPQTWRVRRPCPVRATLSDAAPGPVAVSLVGGVPCR